VQDEVSVHKFVGTETDLENAPVPSGVSKVVQRERTRGFRKAILTSDVVIYDLMTADYEEVDHVIKTFKTTDLLEEKTLILISSVMTWANTPPKIKNEDEEDDPDAEPEEESEPDEEGEGEDQAEIDPDAPPPPKYVYFKETDFHLRVPSPRFQTLKTLETLAISCMKGIPNLNVYVLCAGVLYGHGERVFYNHF
jgi:hypothetical protein